MRYIDLFAGCGGISLGLFNSGLWKGVFAIEKSPMAFETLRYNLIDRNGHFEWPNWLDVANHDIADILHHHKNRLASLKNTIDLVVGGPPCQGFSTAGKRKETDNRNQLLHSYLEFVGIVKPRFILFENVKGFTIGFKTGLNSTRGIPYATLLVQELQKLGYFDADFRIVDFSKFGIPQKRERCIVAASLSGVVPDFFKRIEREKSKFLASKGISDQTSVQEAISDLEQRHGTYPSPDSKGFSAGKYGRSKISEYQQLLRGVEPLDHEPDSHRFVNHRDHIKAKYQDIIKHSYSSKQIRENYPTKKTTTILLRSNQACSTLTTLPDDFIHYREPRILTVREYARIQSFDDWYKIRGKYTTGGEMRTKEVPRYSQLGNAVPPLFMEHCGNVINKLISVEEQVTV